MASLSSACASSLPQPPNIRHRRADFREVPYPPPAALVETVPPRPDEHALWVDGYWDFASGSYVWRRGGWVTAPPGALHAPWVSRFTRDGRIMFAESAWFDAKGRRLSDPELKVPARTPPNEMTGEFQAPR
jgi:hypothetical protein